MTTKVLFINHKAAQCGVHQFGYRTANSLLKYSQNEIFYRELSSLTEFWEEYNGIRPDLTIFNYYPSTLGWYHESIPVNKAVIIHELNMIWGDNYAQARTSFPVIIFPDPTYLESEYYQEPNIVRTVNRAIPDYTPGDPPDTLTIGSFGFAVGGKGFVKVVEDVQKEFDECTIRLHISHATFGDADGYHTNNVVQDCRKALYKDGINLEFSHDFLSEEGLLDWLAGNSMNVFYYDHNLGRGISSTIDYALAVRRPIALSDSFMFRHMPEQSIRIERNFLKDILAFGTHPLEQYYGWTELNLAKEYDNIVKELT